MKIRPSKINEAPLIAELAMKLMSEHAHYDAIFKAKPSAKSLYEAYFRRLPRSGNHRLLVAEDDGRIVGYALGEIKKRPPIYTIEKMGFISDMYLLPEYRKKGFAKSFISELMIWFKKKGVEYADLFVSSKNDVAISVWKKMGFKEFMREKYRKI